MKPNEAIEILDGLKETEESIVFFFDPDDIRFEHLQERFRTQNQALDYAIELAKRDEAMKVVRTEYRKTVGSEEEHYFGNQYSCSKCNGIILTDKYKSSIEDLRTIGVIANFCPDCGQRLDWSDVK